MERHVVIGTAGHVDHGKTSLVKALTGTDTDRLAEEKRRGITIDLGFAVLDLGDGTRASIVDVPGHEDFVRNMVAGATGVDVALLVVAADEGIMPQTEEHLAILSFLGIRRGVIAITKSDLAEPDWVALVADEVAERAGRNGVRWDAIVPTSTVTGSGIEKLKHELARVSHDATQRDGTDLFRLPVDRVFSLPGAGTVVTGTTWSGTARVGGDVTVYPGGHHARVRSVEVHGATSAAAEPGRRTALALVGVDKSDVTRGSVVVAGGEWRETTAVDARISLLPASRPITQRTRLRLHIGTAEVIARATPEAEEITGGKPGFARLRLEAPIVARWGDRGVVRSYSPVTTIGGIEIVDPWPPARPRRPANPAGRGNPAAEARLSSFVELAGRPGLAMTHLSVRVGIHPAEVQTVVDGARDLAVTGSTLFARTLVESAMTRGEAALATYHKTHPLEPGMPREAFRRTAGHALADLVEKRSTAAKRIVIEGGTVRLTAHVASTGGQTALEVAVQQALEKGGREGCTLDELRQRVPEGDVSGIAQYLARRGAAVKVGPDRYYSSGVIKELVTTLLGELEKRGTMSVAQIRDAIGLTRKYLIPFLEWTDSKGFTRRDGDGRNLGPAAAQGLP